MKPIFTLLVLWIASQAIVFGQDEPAPTQGVKIKHPKIVAYQFNRDFTSIDSIGIDTTLHNFQIFYKPFSERALNTFLGTFPQPYISNIYTNRKSYSDFLFSQYVEYTFHQPEDIIYYKTWSPFTQLTYYTGGPRTNQEQKLNIIHTQNINENLNVGFLGDLNSGEGYYVNQRTKSNSFTLYAGYKGTRYSIYGNISSTNYKGQENGGIRNDSDYLYVNEEPETTPVNLENANTVIKRRTIFLNQRFYLTGSYKEDTIVKGSRWNEVLSVVHRFQFDRYQRNYTDDLLATSAGGYQDKNFYDYSISNFATFIRDSSYFRRYENIFLIAINANPWLKIPAELRFGIKNQADKIKYGTFNQSNSVYGLAESTSMVEKSYFNNALVGSLTNRFSKTINWGANAEIFFTGYKLGNFKLEGEIEKTIKGNVVLKVIGSIANTKAGYFINEYSSAFQSWSTSLPSQQTAIVQGNLHFKKIKLQIDGQIANYNNFVYFGSDARPTVAGKAFSVQSLNINKLIDWGVFHNDLRLSFQRSENEDAVQIPSFSMFNSMYLKFTLFKVLTLSPGVGFYYNSSYYSNAYMPETGLFYLQKEEKNGDYPYLDMFLNIKLKRFRFFIKYDRVNTFLPNSKGFFLPQYPFNPSVIKYGLSWTFYD